MRRTRTLCIVATSLFTATAAQARKKAKQAPLPTYEELDENGDDVLALPELTVKGPHLDPRIRHCDANDDGRIAREEYAACKPKRGSAEAC